MATELGGPVEKLWGMITKNGDENSLRVFYQMAEHLRPLMQDLRCSPLPEAHRATREHSRRLCSPAKNIMRSHYHIQAHPMAAGPLVLHPFPHPSSPPLPPPLASLPPRLPSPLLRPASQAIPRSTPIIATHCFVGMLAVSLGFKHVINLVIDNYAQWFIVVPGAYNLVQGPSNYHNLLRMGVPADR